MFSNTMFLAIVVIVLATLGKAKREADAMDNKGGWSADTAKGIAGTIFNTLFKR